MIVAIVTGQERVVSGYRVRECSLVEGPRPYEGFCPSGPTEGHPVAAVADGRKTVVTAWAGRLWARFERDDLDERAFGLVGKQAV